MGFKKIINYRLIKLSKLGQPVVNTIRESNLIKSYKVKKNWA